MLKLTPIPPTPAPPFTWIPTFVRLPAYYQFVDIYIPGRGRIHDVTMVPAFQDLRPGFDGFLQLPDQFLSRPTGERFFVSTASHWMAIPDPQPA